MIRHVLLLAAVVMVAASVDASAGTVSKPKIVAHGDVSIPTGPQEFVDAFSLGLGGGVGVGLPLWSRLAVVADVDYKIFSIDEEQFRRVYGVPPTVGLSGDQMTALYASLSLKVDLISAPKQIRPYLLGGVGYFRLKPDDFASDDTSLGFQTEETYGVNAGAGVEIVLAPYLILFLDAAYVVGFTENADTRYLSVRPGIAFDWKLEE
jgi:hypothetical protein